MGAVAKNKSDSKVEALLRENVVYLPPRPCKSPLIIMVRDWMGICMYI